MMILRRATRKTVVWAAVIGVVTGLTAAPPASATTVVPDGVYGIAFQGDEDALLTHLSVQEGSPTVLLPPFGAPGHQEWEIVRDSRTTQLIRNLHSGLYLGLGGGSPEQHRLVVATPYPHSWSVRVGSAPDRVHISSVQGDERLRLDRSPAWVYPPRVDIQLPRDDGSQEWELTPHE
ncbi:hypothetical protein ACQPYE_15015 [Actinosynnema sp. CA-299493]